MLVAPLPDASALVVFRDLSAASSRTDDAGVRDDTLGDLAFEQLLLPAESAVQKLAAAIPAAQSPGAFQALGAAMQGLKDGLARARELRALAGTQAASTGPLPELAAALAARGLTLACPPEAAAWPPDLRRAALALGLAIADLAAPGAGVSLGLDAAEGPRRLTARAAAGPRSGPAEGVAAALARRVVEAAGGSLKLTTADGAATLTADLPPARQDDAAPDLARRA